jgi:hypothetical protein
MQTKSYKIQILIQKGKGHKKKDRYANVCGQSQTRAVEADPRIALEHHLVLRAADPLLALRVLRQQHRTLLGGEQVDALHQMPVEEAREGGAGGKTG